MNISTLKTDLVKRRLNELRPSAWEVIRMMDVSYDEAMADNGHGFWMVAKPEKDQKDILLCSLDGKTVMTREPGRECLIHEVEMVDSSVSTEIYQLQKLTVGNVFVPTEEVEDSPNGVRYIVWDNPKSPADKVTVLRLHQVASRDCVRRFFYLDKDRPVKLDRGFEIKVQP